MTEKEEKDRRRKKNMKMGKEGIKRKEMNEIVNEKYGSFFNGHGWMYGGMDEEIDRRRHPEIRGRI